MAGTVTKRIWFKPWLCQALGKFPIVNLLGRNVPVNPTCIEAFKAMDMALRATGFVVRQSVGTYNCRPITGGIGYSLHAYGIAVDIDPLYNPYIGTFKFDWAKTSFTKAQIDAVLNIRTNNGAKVFMWGGYWSSIKDYMHFEIDVAPKDLATGINWNTVAVAEEEEMTLTQIRLEIATRWHIKTGVWMSADADETAQQRLSRLANEVQTKKRTIDDIISYAGPKAPVMDVGEKVPAWVLDWTIPA